MLELLQFVFSSFWVWFGTVILLGVVTTSIATVFAGFIGAAKS